MGDAAEAKKAAAEAKKAAKAEEMANGEKANAEEMMKLVRDLCGLAITFYDRIQTITRKMNHTQKNDTYTALFSERTALKEFNGICVRMLPNEQWRTEGGVDDDMVRQIIQENKDKTPSVTMKKLKTVVGAMKDNGEDFLQKLENCQTAIQNAARESERQRKAEKSRGQSKKRKADSPAPVSPAPAAMAEDAIFEESHTLENYCRILKEVIAAAKSKNIPMEQVLLIAQYRMTPELLENAQFQLEIGVYDQCCDEKE